MTYIFPPNSVQDMGEIAEDVVKKHIDLCFS